MRIFAGINEISLFNVIKDSADFINENCQYEIIDIYGCYWCDLAVNYFDFNYQMTDGSMTIAISDISDLINGDIVGVFYVFYKGV